MTTIKTFVTVKQLEGNPESAEVNESFSTDFNEVKILPQHAVVFVHYTLHNHLSWFWLG